MSLCRDEMEWNHTASVMCLLANLHRDAKKHPQPYQPHEFHPHEQRKRKENIPKVPITVLRDLFVPKKKK